MSSTPNVYSTIIRTEFDSDSFAESMLETLPNKCSILETIHLMSFIVKNQFQLVKAFWCYMTLLFDGFENYKTLEMFETSKQMRLQFRFT